MLDKLLIPLTVLTSVVLPSTTGDMFTIESSKLTNWGDWGEWEYCPQGTYAQAAVIKVQPQSVAYKVDNTGLNGIRLYCGDPKDTATPTITSTVGPWGSWYPLSMDCPKPLVGFQLLSERPYERLDEIGAINIRFHCVERVSYDSPFRMWVKTLQQGKNLAWWGLWTGERTCGFDHAICGIQTQVQGAQYGDDTGLNNVRFACCDIEFEE